jgi:hypothetical protein
MQNRAQQDTTKETKGRALGVEEKDAEFRPARNRSEEDLSKVLA